MLPSSLKIFWPGNLSADSLPSPILRPALPPPTHVRRLQPPLRIDLQRAKHCTSAASRLCSCNYTVQGSARPKAHSSPTFAREKKDTCPLGNLSGIKPDFLSRFWLYAVAVSTKPDLARKSQRRPLLESGRPKSSQTADTPVRPPPKSTTPNEVFRQKKFQKVLRRQRQHKRRC